MLLDEKQRDLPYNVAIQRSLWDEALLALKAGARPGYVDPSSRKLDIEIVKKARPTPSQRDLAIVLEGIYSDLAKLPEAHAVVDRHVKEAVPENSLFFPSQKKQGPGR